MTDLGPATPTYYHAPAESLSHDVQARRGNVGIKRIAVPGLPFDGGYLAK
jgi:hypothetical protein